MEEKVVYTDSVNEKCVLEKHELFLYKCEERQYIGKRIKIRFSRDDSPKYIEELKKLEETYPKYKIGSMLPTFIFPAIAIILFTVFLVLFVLNKENFNLLLYFGVLAVPAILCLFASVLFMFLRARMIKRIEIEKPETDQKYQEKIKEIISKY